MINKIIEWFYPFSDDPDKFVIKHKPSWFSWKYRYIYYSGNGGKSFRKILKSNRPLFEFNENILEYNWSFDYFTFDITETSFSDIKKRFSSLSIIRKFIDEEYDKFLKGKKRVLEERKIYLDRIEKNYK